MESGFKYDIVLFQSAIGNVEEAIIKLQTTRVIASEANGISETYDGRDLVDSAIAILVNLLNDVIILYNDMRITLNLMQGIDGGNNGNNFQLQTLSNILGINGSGNVTMQYYTADGVENYNAVAPIAAGSAQGKDFCLATARIYCQLVCRDKFKTDSYDECNGYNFASSNDALEYVKKEIESGYPVVVEVDNRGEAKVSRHFAMAFAVSEDGNDVLYLDPVAGEVKKLGEGWQDYGLMARNLYDEGTGNYWIGSFSGSDPGADYGISNKGNDNSKFQNLPEEYSDSKYWASPYNPYGDDGYVYQASIYLSDGTTICGNGDDLYSTSNSNNTTFASNQPTVIETDTQPIVIDIPLENNVNPTTGLNSSLAPSLNEYHGPQNMPWIAPGATHDNYLGFQGSDAHNA